MSLVQIRSRPHSAPTTASSHAAADPLTDAFQRRVEYLRLSLTDRCNYRCTYCMPERGIDHVDRVEILSFAEIEQMLRAFVRWGVRRVRLTGGEPTLRKGLVDLVARLTAILRPDGTPLELVMTTNGDRLDTLAEPLRKAGLSALTVSLDSLDPARFHRITRRGALDRVLQGLEAARAAGFRKIKLNTVAVRGFNDDELGDICRYAWDRDMVPRFIEVMPMAGGETYLPGELLPAAEIRAGIAAALGGNVVPDAGEGVKGAGPATYWRLEADFVQKNGHSHRFGTIAAMTENFCGTCNRVRVSAIGQLHACLANDDAGDLRAALRADDGARLEGVVRRVLGAKRDSHRFCTDGTGGPEKAMISIGG